MNTTCILLPCSDGDLRFFFEEARRSLQEVMPSFSEVPSVIASDARELAWVSLCNQCEDQSLQLRSPNIPMEVVQSGLQIRFCELSLAFLKMLSK